MGLMVGAYTSLPDIAALGKSIGEGFPTRFLKYRCK